MFKLARFGAGNSSLDGSFARVDLFFLLYVGLLLFQFTCFGTGNSGFDGSFAWVNQFFWFYVGLLLFQLARFGTGDSSLDGSFAWVNQFFWFYVGLLLFQLARFGAGDSSLDGSFARIILLLRFFVSWLLFQLACFSTSNCGFDCCFTWIGNDCIAVGLLQFCLFRSGLRFTRFPCRNNRAVIRAFASFYHNRLCGLGLFFFYASQSCSNRIFVFGSRLNRRVLVSFKTCGFFTFQTCLTSFKARFCLCGAFFFLTNGCNLGFFLTEILHKWDIAGANPCAGPAFNTIGNVMCGGLIVLLAFAKPVQLLWQKIGRAGISTGATADAILFFLRLAKFISRRCQ